MSCKKPTFLAQIEELILSMKLHKNHNMAFLSRIWPLSINGTKNNAKEFALQL